MNPKWRKARRRSYSSRSSGQSNLLLYAGLALILYPMLTRQAGAVSTGGQSIVPQDPATYWISDAFNGGDGTFFQGSLPPGSAPPWRLASQAEVSAFTVGLASGAYSNAGGGLYPVSTGLIF